MPWRLVLPRNREQKNLKVNFIRSQGGYGTKDGARGVGHPFSAGIFLLCFVFLFVRGVAGKKSIREGNSCHCRSGGHFNTNIFVRVHSVFPIEVRYLLNLKLNF